MHHLRLFGKLTLTTLFLTIGIVARLNAQAVCPTSNEVTITVIAEPSINITGATTICAGGTATLNATTGNGVPPCTIQWQLSANGTSGWTNIAGANAASYTTTTLTATTYYRATYTCSGSGCDAATSNSQTITVVPDLTISAQPQPITQCVGGTLQMSVTPTAGTGTGTVTYQWQSSPDNVAWTNISGATSSTLTPPSGTVGTVYYRAVINASGVGCDAVISNSATAITVPDLTITTHPAPVTTQCIGGAISINVFATVGTGTGTISYQWQSSTDGNTGWTNIGGATASTYTPSTTSAGTTYYRCIISATGNGCDPITSNNARVDVRQDLAITAQPQPFDECVGGTLPLNVTVTNGDGTITYQWQSSANGTSGWTDIAGANSSTYTPLSTLAATTFYRVVVSAAGNGCDGITSNATQVRVYPDLTVATQPQPITECVGGTLQMSVTPTAGTGQGTITYQWQSSTDNTTFVNISGATSSTFTPTSTLAGTTYYRVIIDAAGDGCDAVTSNSATAVVVPDLTVANQPQPITECIGGALTMSVTPTVGTGTGTISYQWQSSTDNTTFANVSGATSATFTPTSTSAGVTYYRVIISATGNGCGSVTSNSATATITNDVAITAQPQPFDECVGGTLNMSVTVANGTGTITYQWQSSTDNTTFANISGANSSTYTPLSTSAGTTYYRVIVSVAGNGCDGITSNSAQVRVYPDLTVATQPQPIVECLDGTTQLSVTPTAGTGQGTITYQWQSSTDNSSFTNVLGATNSTYTPPSTAVGVRYYRVVIDAVGDGCDAVVSNSARVEIVPELVVTTQPQPITQCQGGSLPLSVAVTNGTGTITYQWQSSTDNTTFTNILGATSATYTPPSTTVGVVYYRAVIDASGDGCDAVTSNSARVEITPDVTITAQPQDVTECVGGNLPISVTIQNGTGAITYQWQASTDGSTNWTNIQNATSATYTPQSVTAATTFYRVVITVAGNGCDPIISANSRVEITPDLTISVQPQNITECIDGNLPLSVTPTAGTGVGTITYQWQSSPDNLAWTNVAGATASTYTPPSATAGATYYRVVISASGNGCNVAISDPALVTIVAKPVINITMPASAVCVGGIVTLSSSTTGGTGTCTIQWQNSTNGGSSWNDIGGATTPTYTTPALSSDTKYRARYTCSGSGCCNPDD